jgi:16S rRNA (cytosine1402-N4)-methyltransferase
MSAEVLEYLRPQAGGTLVDATVGFGGHASAILARIAPGGRLIAIDRDPDACSWIEARLRPVAEDAGVRLHIVQANFAALGAVLDQLGVETVAGVLFDFGVSSAQLDRAERGFSYREDAPLDMRMDPSQRTTAYHLVNGLSEDELAEIIHNFGQERWSRRIAAFIVRRRQERGLIATTGELVEVIKAAVPAGARKDGPHPARRTFQALRIAVNNELGAVEAGVRAAAARLEPGGRLVALSFHSLEDRIVKHVLRELAAGCTCPPDWPVCRCGALPTMRPLLQRPLQPTAAEAAMNPRARSAKRRAALRLGVPPHPVQGGLVVPQLYAGARREDEPPPATDCVAPVPPVLPHGGLAAVLAGLLSLESPATAKVAEGRLGPSGLPSLADTLYVARPAGSVRIRPYRRLAEARRASDRRSGPVLHQRRGE